MMYLAMIKVYAFLKSQPCSLFCESLSVPVVKYQSLAALNDRGWSESSKESDGFW